MSDTSALKRARRTARAKGYLLHKLPDQLAPMDSVEVIECSIHGGDCHATGDQLDGGHWRSHFSVFSGDLEDVTDWLSVFEDRTSRQSAGGAA